MPDNVRVDAGNGPQIATDEVGSVQYQVVKLATGGDGAAALLADGNRLPVALDPALSLTVEVSNSPDVTIANASPLQVSVANPTPIPVSLPASPLPISIAAPTELPVHISNDAGEPVPISVDTSLPLNVNIAAQTLGALSIDDSTPVRVEIDNPEEIGGGSSGGIELLPLSELGDAMEFEVSTTAPLIHVIPAGETHEVHLFVHNDRNVAGVGAFRVEIGAETSIMRVPQYAMYERKYTITAGASPKSIRARVSIGGSEFTVTGAVRKSP